jgi:tripartite-type tricarboxylate transporter receptor subunit TctC
MKQRRFLHLAGLVAVVAVLSATLSGGDVRSQAARTIKFVVPYAPGGANDILARLLAEQINRQSGSNRSSRGGNESADAASGYRVAVYG